MFCISDNHNREISSNEDENNSVKQLVKDRTSKSYKNPTKRKRVQKNFKKTKDYSDDDEPINFGHQKLENTNKQKYFIVVEEVSSKGTTENLMFLVEENPSQVFPESRKNVKRPNKRSKFELRDVKSVKSPITDNANTSKENNISRNKNQIISSKLDGDTERQPLQVNN